MKLFTTSWNRPTVRQVSGREMTVMSGFTRELTSPRNRPTKAKLSQGSAVPKGWMPGTMNAATAMAMDVRSQLRKKRMGGLSGRFGAARRGSLVDSARRAGV